MRDIHERKRFKRPVRRQLKEGKAGHEETGIDAGNWPRGYADPTNGFRLVFP